MAEKALSKALLRLNILREERKIVLKPEQETAVSESLHGKDVMAVWQKHDFYRVCAHLTRIVDYLVYCSFFVLLFHLIHVSTYTCLLFSTFTLGKIIFITLIVYAS